MALESIQHFLGLLERHLTHQTFIVGERVSLADIALVCTLAPVFAKVLDAPTRSRNIPSVTRWYITCRKQAAFASLGAVVLLGEGAAAGAGGGAAAGSSGANVSHGAVSGDLFRRKRIRVREVLANGAALVGSVVTVSGWVKTARDQVCVCRCTARSLCRCVLAPMTLTSRCSALPLSHDGRRV